MVNFDKNGVNWVKQLPVYARILNEDTKEALKWMSPFEVYYGRKSNRVRHSLLESPSSVDTEFVNTRQCTEPSMRQREIFEAKQKKVREMAKRATKQFNERMIRHASKQSPPSVYNVNDAVLVRVKDGAHRVSKRFIVLPGKIVEKNVKLSKYKVCFQNPNDNKKIK